MENKKKIFNIMNEMLKESKDKRILQALPISEMDLFNDEELSELVIDYFSEIHMVVGFDEKYDETEQGRLISQVIDIVMLATEGIG